ncbi:uncharacterized protein E0L32_008630 [Thyridium curvatum]|uniref:Copper acquisition factor BIM1-like domain-containing protein n=1 Tax=Thyridium curvatum TaxID=1093900 RepID=A0A507AZX1_9PEZI|nr:uncharacterized protein E0L32_008630 [Thyridium curvatum]TPX10411.1 hypothetical protein E0L32_008630 [Thyridium curvatum]
MAPLASLSAAALLLFSTVANAHFTLQTPPTIGFDDDKEGTGPCGGFAPDFSKPTAEFHVGGEPVGAKMLHPQAKWLFRATLDEKASGNWTQLFPIVFQSGLGEICEPAIPAPESWVGKNGVFSIVANAPDGLLYQCSIVKFVSGKGEVPSSGCRNASSISVSFDSDPQLSALVTPGGSSGGSSGSNASATTGTGGKGGSPTTSGGSASQTSASPGKNGAGGFVESSLSVTNMLVVAAAGCLGAAFIL